MPLLPLERRRRVVVGVAGALALRRQPTKCDVSPSSFSVTPSSTAIISPLESLAITVRFESITCLTPVRW
jgi:hypothetical protein